MGSFTDIYYLCLSLRERVHKASQSYPGKRSLDKQLLRLFNNNHLTGCGSFLLQAPNDSLDFVIKSTYNHHKEFLSSKAETLVQHETVGLPHGYVSLTIHSQPSMCNHLP